MEEYEKNIDGLFSPRAVEDVTLRLFVNAEGKTEILCEKNDRRLKAVPARLRGEPAVIELENAKKALNVLYRQTRDMLREAVSMRKTFTVKELSEIYANPSLKPLLTSLHFIKDDNIGVFTPDKLITSGGAEIPLSEGDELRAAHSYYNNNALRRKPGKSGV